MINIKNYLEDGANYKAQAILAIIRGMVDCEAFYDRIQFKNYFITDLSSPDVDRAQLKFRCESCGKQARRMKKWRLRNKSFNADFYCQACDRRFSARVSFKKRYDGVKVTRKIIS